MTPCREHLRFNCEDCHGKTDPRYTRRVKEDAMDAMCDAMQLQPLSRAKFAEGLRDFVEELIYEHVNSGYHSDHEES